MLVAEYKGSRIVSTDLTDEQWDDIYRRSRVKATSPIHNPYNGLPMHCAQRHVINGLRWFCMFHGDPNGLTGPETRQHMSLKLEVCRAARALGYKAEVEWPSKDRSWIADVMIWRPDNRPLAVEIQWTAQVDPQYKDRSDRYEKDGVDCVWLDHRMSPFGNEISRREYLCRDDIPDAQNWVGLKPVDGVVHMPVDKDMRVRYDGAWHTASDMTAALLEGSLGLHEHSKVTPIRLYEYKCWKCRQRICAWLLPVTKLWPTGHRVEEEYTDLVKDWVWKHRRGYTPCRIEDTWSNTAHSTYRAFQCPFCKAIQGDWFLAMEDEPTAIIDFTDSNMGVVKLFHSDLPEGADGPLPIYGDDGASNTQNGMSEDDDPWAGSDEVSSVRNETSVFVQPLMPQSAVDERKTVQKDDVSARIREAVTRLGLEKVTINQVHCLKRPDGKLAVCPLFNDGTMSKSAITKIVQERKNEPYQMLMFDAGMEWSHVERDDWKLYETVNPPTWSGSLQTIDGLFRLPLDPYDLTVRYDGEWHSLEDCLTDILDQRLTIHKHPCRPGASRMMSILHTDRIPHDAHKAYDLPPVTCFSLLNAHPTERSSSISQKEHTLKQLGMRSCFPSEPVPRRKIHAIRMTVLRMILDDPQRVNGKWSVDGWTLYCDDADYEVREYDLSERDRAKATHMLKVAEQSHSESHSQD